MLDTYLSRLETYSRQLALLNAKRKTGTIRDQISRCQAEITYNRNRILCIATHGVKGCAKRRVGV